MSKVPLPIHGADHCPGGPDPIPCLSAGLPFASAQTTDRSISGPTNSSYFVDWSTGTTFRTNDSRLAIVDDFPNTPQYGISVPANFLARVTVSVAIFSGSANGRHEIGWAIAAAYSVTEFGPARDANFWTTSWSANGMADDGTLPEALILTSYLGDTTDWVVGASHRWAGWTDDPKDFRYDLCVELVGTLPT